MKNEQFVGFMLGIEHYGVNIMGVEEIIRMMDITRVPRAPDFVEGIINLRGRIIPVVDLRKRLNIKISDCDNESRIIVIRLENRRLGFIVDRVEQVMYISAETVAPAPGITKGQNYVEGVARTEKGMVIILDALKIFNPDEKLLISKIN